MNVKATNLKKSGQFHAVLASFVTAILLTTSLSSYPAQASSSSVQSFSPNIASSVGGDQIVVTGKGLDKVTRVRVAGVVQSKLLNRSKTKFSFVMPRLSKSLQQYGGYVGIEFMQAGVWRKASPKFLVTAPRDKTFTSAGLVFKFVETSTPAFVPQDSRYGDRLPSPGAQLHGVKLNVLNMTDSWIDLTCSFEVDVRVIDTTFRRFTYVEDLYKISGNPGCNDFMNPGFSADTLWVFDVPTRFKTAAIEVKTVTWTGKEPRTYYFAF